MELCTSMYTWHTWMLVTIALIRKKVVFIALVLNFVWGNPFSPFQPLLELILNSHHFLQALSGELSPFMCSASHLNQMDRHPSTIGAFLEGVVKCKPLPHVRSCVMKVKGSALISRVDPDSLVFRFKLFGSLN